MATQGIPNVAGAAGMGALSGAQTGAALGSVVPGIGTAVGAAGGAIIGGLTAGLKQNKANNAQEIPFVDPLERERLTRLEQQSKSLMAGTDAVTQGQIGQLNNQNAATQNAITKNTGGDVGATMDALLRGQKNTQANINQATLAGQQRLPYFDSAAGNLLSRVAQRRLELQRLRRDQLVAENAQSRTENNVNANSLLATQGGTQTIPEALKMLMGGITTPQTGSTSEISQGLPVIGGINTTPDYTTPIGDQTMPVYTGVQPDLYTVQ